MTNKTIEIIFVVAIVGSFAVGRYSVQSPAITKETDTAKDSKKDTEKNTHKETTTIVEEGPSCKKTTTTVTEDTSTKKRTDTQLETHENTTITPPKVNTLNVSALAGLDIHQKSAIYGVALTKEIIGPVTAGAYGLTNGTIGVSLGLNF